MEHWAIMGDYTFENLLPLCLLTPMYFFFIMISGLSVDQMNRIIYWLKEKFIPLSLVATVDCRIKHKTIILNCLIKIIGVWSIRDHLRISPLILSEFKWINIYAPELVNLYSSWNNHKTIGFLMISWGIEVN